MSLSIFFDSTVASAGSLLQGHVAFSCNKVVSGTDVLATLIGKEKTVIRYEETYTTGTGDNRRTERRTRYARSDRSIVQVAIPVNVGGRNGSTMIQPNGKINPGSYSIPFSIQLPKGLPSSFSFSRHGSSCSIEYKIKAVIKGSGTLWNYHCEQYIPVQAEPSAAIYPVPFNGDPTIETVNFCCCINRGQIAVAAHADDTDIQRGQSIQVAMACRNNSTADVQSITASINQEIRWHAGSRSERTHTVLRSFQFGAAGLLKGRKKVGNIETAKEFPQMVEELNNRAHSGTLQLPFNALDTYAGSLIRISHYLTIIVSTSCCIDNPTIKIPIQSSPPRPPTTSNDTPTTLPVDAGNENHISPSAPPQEEDNIAYVPASNFVIGGTPSAPYETEVENEQEIVLPSTADVLNRPPTIENLLLDMGSTINEIQLVEERTKDPAWEPVLASITPAQYGRMIRSVSIDFNQARIAEIIANNHNGFRCDHVVEALKNASEWNRVTVVEKLIPSCNDLPQNKHKILAVLSDWDRTITERAFEKALKKYLKKKI